MKVIVYNINQEDKINLALANRRKHKITVITDPLTDNNVDFAHHKDAVIIINQDKPVSYLTLIEKLKFLGIKLIIFRLLKDLIFDESVAEDSGFEYTTIKAIDSKKAASLIIETLDYWEKK